MRAVIVAVVIVSFALTGCVVRSSTSWRLPSKSSPRVTQASLSCHRACQRTADVRACFARCPGVQKVMSKSCTELASSSLVCEDETKTNVRMSLLGSALMAYLGFLAFGLLGASRMEVGDSCGSGC